MKTSAAPEGDADGRRRPHGPHQGQIHHQHGLHVRSRAGATDKERSDAELIVVSMGPASFEQSLKKPRRWARPRDPSLGQKAQGSDTFAYRLRAGLAPQETRVHEGRQRALHNFRRAADHGRGYGPCAVPDGGEPRHSRATFVEKVEFLGDHLKIRRIIEGGFQILKVRSRALFP